MNRVVALLVVATVALVGCQAQAEHAAKAGSGELRTELDPLLSRFPVLGTPAGARWMSGTYGRADVPGPSTYWIDAVVTLQPVDAQRIVSTYAPTDEGEEPDVVDGVRADVPGGPFLTGEALDAAFGSERWHASAYLEPESGKLVLVATGN